jgi:hypothetical protein
MMEVSLRRAALILCEAVTVALAPFEVTHGLQWNPAVRSPTPTTALNHTHPIVATGSNANCRARDLPYPSPVHNPKLE